MIAAAPAMEAGRCAACGRDVAMAEVVIYHGVVYHAACVMPAVSPN